MNEVDVAIVGAGFAGIAMAMRLRREGRTSFVVVERATDVGGTWRDNVYPGIACDVPSHLYCFADHPNPAWSRMYAGGEEIQSYLREVVAAEGLRDYILLETPMLSAAYEEGRWTLELGGGTPRHLRAASVVLACGRLSEPRVPLIDGFETFTGQIFHSARWDPDVSVDGAKVAVVGAGASAVQLAPELARRGADVILFQRTPAWIVPRGDRAYTEEERSGFAASPSRVERIRQSMFLEGEAQFPSRAGDAVAAATARQIAIRHLRDQVPDARLRRILTPEYGFGCKRVLLSDDFYPSLVSGAVTLVPSALAKIVNGSLVARDGSQHRADIIVLATGFETTRQPYAWLIKGASGRLLAEHWSEGMTAFASTLVAGFPDLYIVNGPNASLGHNSAVLMIEEQTEFVVRCLAVRERVEGSSIRVRHEDEKAYADDVARLAAGTSWMVGGCRSWYVDDRSGRLTLLWPGTVHMFRERLARVDLASLTHVPAEGYA